jgi:hypothetical protein
MTLAVLETVRQVAEDTLPIPAVGSSSKVRSITPGWKSDVKHFRDNAFFWHQVWESCGRPINTEVHRVMKRTRNVYHYQYRKCKNAEERIKRDKLLSARPSQSLQLQSMGSQKTFLSILVLFTASCTTLLMIVRSSGLSMHVLKLR